jgi:glycosyltransferase involved in cell wall biosynthesis
MRVALLSADDRERFKLYDNDQPMLPTPQAALLSGLQDVPGLEIHYISCLQQPVRSPEKLADNIWFHTLHVPKTGWMRTLYQGCVRAIRKKLSDLQPDIVHGQGSERESALGAALSGFPNVITIHGNMKAIAELYRAPLGSFFWLAARLETFSLHRSDGVFCNSLYTENMVLPRAQKTWRVPNAVRAPFYSPLPSHPQNARPILLNVGVVEPRKRQKEILRMAQNLWERGLRFEIHFIGLVSPGVAYDDEFLQELAVAQTAGYARHLGRLQTDQLIATMDAADALVHFPTEESFGLVVTEALARNLKLFASSVGGIVETSADVEGAELFSVSDFTGLENSIASWLAAGCPRPLDAAEIMRRRYSPEVVARRHLEIYREALNTRS